MAGKCAGMLAFWIVWRACVYLAMPSGGLFDIPQSGFWILTSRPFGHVASPMDQIPAEKTRELARAEQEFEKKYGRSPGDPASS